MTISSITEGTDSLWHDAAIEIYKNITTGYS